jgi:hypothetical protein
MKKIISSLIVLILFSSCDYKVALVEKPQIQIDNKLTGTWERTNKQKKIEKLLILPIDEYEYFIAYPLGNNAMFAKACFCNIANKTLVQIKWFGTAEGVIPKDGRVYQYLEYKFDKNKLNIQMLNTKVINKDIKTSTELKNQIKANIDNSKLFYNPMSFTKILQNKK